MPLPTLQQLNIAQPQPGTMKLQAMKMQDMQTRTGLAERQVGVQEDKLAMQEEEYNYQKLQRHVKKAREFLPQVDADNYYDYVAWNVESGLSKELFKTPEEFSAMTPKNQEAYKLKLAKSADDLVATDLATQKARAAAQIQKQKDDVSIANSKRAANARIDAANISKDKTETEKAKKLKGLASDYFQQTGRGYSAERGTGQFIPDENKMKVAKKAYDSAQIIAQTYVDAGGKWEDLGLEDPSKAPEAKDDFVTKLSESHPPAEYKGKSGTDTVTGKKYKSDGKSWVEVK